MRLTTSASSGTMMSFPSSSFVYPKKQLLLTWTFPC
nr:MAG TPA: hypothetical protein [Caudoviricetes sp.]